MNVALAALAALAALVWGLVGVLALRAAALVALSGLLSGQSYLESAEAPAALCAFAWHLAGELDRLRVEADDPDAAELERAAALIATDQGRQAATDDDVRRIYAELARAGAGGARS